MLAQKAPDREDTPSAVASGSGGLADAGEGARSATDGIDDFAIVHDHAMAHDHQLSTSANRLANP